MKLLLAITAALALAYLKTHAAEAPPAPAPTARWIDSLSIAPVGVVKTEHLDGPSQWGAGVDVGANLNPFVGIHIVNLAFEGPGQSQKKVGNGPGDDPNCFKTTGPNSWGGSAIDETDLQVDAKLARFSTENFSLHLVGGAQTDWNTHDYGVNVGARVALDFNKHVGVYGGYDLRTWLKGQTRVDSLVTTGIKFTF